MNMWRSPKGMDTVVKGREAYTGSSFDGTGEHAASSTSTTHARRIERKVDSMVVEVMPLILMRKDCLLLLLYNYDVTMFNVNKHFDDFVVIAFKPSFPSQRKVTSLYPYSTASPQRLSHGKTAQPYAYVFAPSTRYSPNSCIFTVFKQYCYFSFQHSRADMVRLAALLLSLRCSTGPLARQKSLVCVTADEGLRYSEDVVGGFARRSCAK